MSLSPRIILLAALMLPFAAARAAAAEAPPLDVLLRLKGTELAASPAVKAAVDRALQAYRGQPPFLELVRAFNRTDQVEGLLELAAARADESVGAEAVLRVIGDGGVEALRSALAGSGGTALVRALGNVADAVATDLLQGVMLDGTRPEAFRLEAVRALARTEAGAQALLALARDGRLPEVLKATAGSALAGSPLPGIKDEAARLLPASTPSEQAVPALAAVLALRGDVARGEKVFFGAAACASCHQVNGRGVDFGPGLSEVGDKFGADALYANIVDPAAGISFGYEPWQITLRNGAAVGFIASETDDELAVKAPGNIISRYRKADVTSRARLPGSLMPPGLLAATNAQEVADLLAYLGSLKKKP